MPQLNSEAQKLIESQGKLTPEASSMVSGMTEPQDIYKQGNVDQNKPGYQKIQNADGSSDAYLVLPKDLNQGMDEATFPVPLPYIDNTNTGFLIRSAGGAITEAAKGVASFGEWLIDKAVASSKSKEELNKKSPIVNPIPGIDDALRSTAEFADYLLGTDISNEKTGWINDNMPVIAANSDTEKVIQEIGSVVAGAGSGVGLISKLKKGKEALSIAEQFWKASGNNKAKFALFLKSFVPIFLGADLGATITTPEGTKPISDMVLPEQVGNLSPEETDRLGNFIDNAAFTFGLGVAGAAGRGAKTFAQGWLPALFKDKSASKEMLAIFDPKFDTSMPDELVKKHLVALKGALGNNMSESVALGGKTNTLDLNVVDTLRKSAKQYVEDIYGPELAKQYSGDALNTAINNQAEEMVVNIINRVRARANSPVVNTSTERLMRQSQKVLDQTTSGIASPEQSINAGKELGSQVIQPIKEAKGNLSMAQTDQLLANSKLSNVQKDNTIIKLMEDNKNLLDWSTDNGVAARNLTGDELFNVWKKDRENVNQMFDNIPNDVGVNRKEFLNTLNELGGKVDEGSIAKLTSPEKTIGSFTDDEIKNIVDKYGETIPFKVLFNEVRPKIVNRIDQLRMSGSDKNVQQLIDVKKYIDEIANSSAATEGPVANAMNTYKQFADKWRKVPELEVYDAKAMNVGDVGFGAEKNKIALTDYGFETFEQLANSKDTEKWTRFANILDQANSEGNQIAVEYILGKTLRQLNKELGNGTKPITAEVVRNVFEPLQNSFKNLSPDVMSKAKDAFNSLLEAEQGLAKTTDVAERLQTVYDELLANSQKKAAGKFVYDILEQAKLGNDLRLLEDGQIGKAFDDIFNHKNSPQLIEQLMNQAGNNQAVKDGIKAQYLRYLKDKILTNTTLGFTGGGTGVIKDASNSKLSNFLGSGETPQIDALRKVFAGDKETLDGVTQLLDIMASNTEARNFKPLAGESNTAFNLMDSKKAKDTATKLVTLMFGVLSHTGAVVRAMSFGQIDKAVEKNNKIAMAIYDRLITNPNFLKDTLEVYAKQGEKGLTQQLQPVIKELYRGYMTSNKQQVPTTKTDIMR